MSGTAQEHLEKGFALSKDGRLQEAETELRAALRIQPDFALAHNNLGHLLSEQGDVEVAIVEQRKAVSLAPTLAKTHYNLGNALSRGTRENWEPSAEAFQTAVILAPEWRTARVCLANALGRVGRFDEAIAEYQQVLHLAPNDEESWIQLGLILFMRALKEKSRGAAEAAKEAFEHALAVNPHNHVASKLLRDVKNSLRVRHRFRWPWTK